MPLAQEDPALPSTISQVPSTLRSQATLVEAPPMATTKFPTWDAFSVYFTEYQRQTYQVYVGKSSTSVATRNKRIVNMSESKNAVNFGDRLLPSELKLYSKTLICTHGGKPRNRSQSIRPKQNYRPMECPARMNIVAQQKIGCDSSKTSGWHVVVTKHAATHNHPLDADTYMSYPQNRKVQDPMVLEAVNALRKAGVKHRDIRKYISEKEPTKHVTRSDVNNLLTKLKSNNTTTTNAPASGLSIPAPVAQVGYMRNKSTNADVDGPAGNDRTRELTDARSSRGGSASYPTTDGMVNDTISLQSLCVFKQVASGSFKLRGKRLEEQNLALYAQNTMLVEQNRLYVADLNQARKKSAEQEVQLMTLRKSEATLKKALSRSEQQLADLRAENARLVQQAQRQTSNLSGIVLPETVGHSDFTGRDRALKRSRR